MSLHFLPVHKVREQLFVHYRTNYPLLSESIKKESKAILYGLASEINFVFYDADSELELMVLAPHKDDDPETFKCGRRSGLESAAKK